MSFTILHNQRTGWNVYQSILQTNINLISPTEIEKAVSNFNDNLKEAARSATPVVQFKNTTLNNTPDEIKRLILATRKARVKWQHTTH